MMLVTMLNLASQWNSQSQCSHEVLLNMESNWPAVVSWVIRWRLSNGEFIIFSRHIEICLSQVMLI